MCNQAWPAGKNNVYQLHFAIASFPLSSSLSPFSPILQMVSLYYDPDGKKVFSHETTTPSQAMPSDHAVKKAIVSLYGAEFENTEDPQVRENASLLPVMGSTREIFLLKIFGTELNGKN